MPFAPLRALCSLLAVGAASAQDVAKAPSSVSQGARSFRGAAGSVDVADLGHVVILQDFVNQQGGFQQGGFQPGGFQQGGQQGGFQQGGFQQGGQQGGFQPGQGGFQGQGGYQQSYSGGDTKLSFLIALLVPTVVVIGCCCCVIHIVRCLWGEVCSGDMQPILGEELGAVAGYEMGKYMEGHNPFGGGYAGGFGGQPMY